MQVKLRPGQVTHTFSADEDPHLYYKSSYDRSIYVWCKLNFIGTSSEILDHDFDYFKVGDG